MLHLLTSTPFNKARLTIAADGKATKENAEAQLVRLMGATFHKESNDPIHQSDHEQKFLMAKQ